MSNMSYCRWRNTQQDLQDCYENLWDDNLSPEEAKAREWLIELCRDILESVEGGPEEEY